MEPVVASEVTEREMTSALEKMRVLMKLRRLLRWASGGVSTCSLSCVFHFLKGIPHLCDRSQNFSWGRNRVLETTVNNSSIWLLWWTWGSQADAGSSFGSVEVN